MVEALRQAAEGRGLEVLRTREVTCVEQQLLRRYGEGGPHSSCFSGLLCFSALLLCTLCVHLSHLRRSSALSLTAAIGTAVAGLLLVAAAEHVRPHPPTPQQRAQLAAANRPSAISCLPATLRLGLHSSFERPDHPRPGLTGSR